MNDGYAHRPVLLEAVLKGLRVRPQGRYVDGTFGRGGHCAAILERLDNKGALLVFDKDPEALRTAQERFGEDERVRMHQGTFAELETVVAELGWQGKVDGILFDLGVSSPQLDDPGRGFSFLREGPLDMRMDPRSGPSAAEWLGQAAESEIARVLFEYGEERYARRIARAIVRRREQAPIATTTELVELITAAVPARERHKHPATRSFQAIRIFINRELEDLKAGLAQSVAALAPGGRLVVISFHSLEDRIVKRFIRDESRGKPVPPDLPVLPEHFKPRLQAVGRPVKASQQEIDENPRARSAVLRVAERAA